MGYGAATYHRCVVNRKTADQGAKRKIRSAYRARRTCGSAVHAAHTTVFSDLDLAAADGDRAPTTSGCTNSTRAATPAIPQATGLFETGKPPHLLTPRFRPQVIH